MDSGVGSGKAEENISLQTQRQTLFMGLSSSSPSTQSSYFSWPRKKSYWSFVASLAFLCTGLLRAYTSPALLSIQSEIDSGMMPLSSSALSRKDLISWIASTAPLASFLGTILSGPCLQHWGRKRTLSLLSFICTLGWLLIGYASTIWFLLCGRALTGLASGLATATTPLYIAEAGVNENSSFLGLLPGVLLAVGVLFGFVLAHQFKTWRVLALIISIFPILVSILSFTIPESTIWLEKNKSKKEEKDIKFELEMEPVVGTKDKNLLDPSEKSGLIPKKRSKSLFSSQFIFPVCVPVTLMLFQQFSGGNVIIYYLSEILAKNVGHGPTPPESFGNNSKIHESSLIIGVVQFLGFFLAIPLIDRVGRRNLLIASALLMSLPHLVLGFHFHHLESVSDFNRNYVNEWMLLRVCSLCVLLSCYSIGLGPIPFLLIETFTMTDDSETSRKSFGSYVASISSLVNHFSLFVAVKGFPYIFMERPDVTFWIFAGACWTAALFSFWFIPGTHTKSVPTVVCCKTTTKR